MAEIRVMGGWDGDFTAVQFIYYKRTCNFTTLVTTEAKGRRENKVTQLSIDRSSHNLIHSMLAAGATTPQWSF